MHSDTNMPGKDQKYKASGKMNMEYHNSVPGGFQRTYTGVSVASYHDQKDSVKRLSKCRTLGVADSMRMIPQREKDIAGDANSYQWTAGGKECHGFIW